MFRGLVLVLSLVCAFSFGGGVRVARAQAIQVRFSPLKQASQTDTKAFTYFIRTDRITNQAKREQLDRESREYGPILDSGKCVRKQEPSTQQDCVGLVTEWLFWGGSLNTYNEVAKLRGFGANTFRNEFLTKYCNPVTGGASASRNNDVVAFIKTYPNGSTKCLHVAIVTEGGKIVSKDADGSLFLISGGEASLLVPFEGFHFEYWRLKSDLRAEMLYDFAGGSEDKPDAQSTLVGWQPLDSKRVRGRYFLPAQFAQLMKLSGQSEVLEFMATKSGKQFEVDDKKFNRQLQGVFETLQKASSPDNPSESGITINQFKLTISGGRELWNISGKANVTFTTVKQGEKKELTQDFPVKAFAKPHNK